MNAAASPRREGGRARIAPAPRVLDLLMSGKSVERIARAKKLTRPRVEKILRAELRAISIRPARDYAKLQISRLEAMLGRLIVKANDGDLAAVDRVLRISERLDRYHGFGKPQPGSSPPDDRADEAFDRKLADLVARRRRAEAEDAAKIAQTGQDPRSAGAG